MPGRDEQRALPAHPNFVQLQAELLNLLLCHGLLLQIRKQQPSDENSKQATKLRINQAATCVPQCAAVLQVLLRFEPQQCNDTWLIAS